jgi:hypothetical protein
MFAAEHSTLGVEFIFFEAIAPTSHTRRVRFGRSPSPSKHQAGRFVLSLSPGSAQISHAAEFRRDSRM